VKESLHPSKISHARQVVEATQTVVLFCYVCFYIFCFGSMHIVYVFICSSRNPILPSLAIPWSKRYNAGVGDGQGSAL
jgi:hypothetical protein